jgi:hypothetical protein
VVLFLAMMDNSADEDYAEMFDDIDIDVDVDDGLVPPTSKSSDVHVEIPTNVDGITVAQLTKMGAFLMQGMNENEAALLAGIDKLRLTIARRNSVLYNDFVEKKKLEFKAKHLKVLSSRNNPRVSQWLLERLSPSEFSGKSRPPEVPTNVVGAIIKEIQEAGEDTSSLAFAYKDIHDTGSKSQRSSRSEATERIKRVLE